RSRRTPRRFGGSARASLRHENVDIQLHGGSLVNTLLDALLALQAQDDVVDALQKRLDALAPRLADLDVVRQRAVKSIEETRAGVDADERRQRELEGRISDHRQ